MIRTLCNTCLQSFELILEASDLELVRQISDDLGHTCLCPRLCGGSILLVGDDTSREMARDSRLRDPLRLSGKELYKAVLGAGLPDEIARDEAVLQSMLIANSITDVSIEKVGDVLYLHEIRLVNGVTLHLTSGQRGAQVLKMTKERLDGTSYHR